MTRYMGVVYPQFWAKNPIDVEENFQIHLSMLKQNLYMPCEVDDYDKVMFILLLIQNLDCQMFFFKMTMVHNVEAILREDNKLNPIVRLWQKVSTPAIFNHELFEYMKFAKIAIIQVLGSIENKCTFEKNCFMNNKLWNRLKTNLDSCTKFYN